MVFEEKDSDVGSYLRNFRRSKAITIEAVAQKTKIRPTVLRQIESGDLGRMPSATFAKGFIRAYTEAVGADTQKALQLYQSSLTQHSRSEQAQAAPERSRSSFWPLLAALAFLACLIAATLYLADWKQRNASTVPAAEPADPQTVPQTPVEPTPPTGTTEHSTSSDAQATSILPREPLDPATDSGGEAHLGAPEQDMAQATMPEAPAQEQIPSPIAKPERPADVRQNSKWILQINALETTWLRIVRDDGPPRELTLYQDNQISLEAQEKFEMLIGNAGGIQLKLNNQPVKIKGQSGKVVKLRLP